MTKKLPSHVSPHAPLAGFERRLYAIAIDMLLLSFLAVVFNIYRIGLLLLVLQALYFSLCWSYFQGITVGNRIMHIQVKSISAEPLSIQQALIRYAGFLLSGIVFFLGFAWIIWDKEKQGWHDKLAKTIVVAL